MLFYNFVFNKKFIQIVQLSSELFMQHRIRFFMKTMNFDSIFWKNLVFEPIFPIFAKYCENMLLVANTYNFLDF